MLDKSQRTLLDQLLATLSRDQRIWLAGYVNGLCADGTVAEPTASALTLHVYYATETGNSKNIALSLEKAAKARGFKSKSTPLSRVKPSDLTKLNEPAIFIISTHGEGDPPDMAKKFFAELGENTAKEMTSLRYAVLGLGDKSYAQFCQAALTVDDALASRGAERFYPTQLLDVDFEAYTAEWIEKTLGALGPAVTAQASVSSPSSAPSSGIGYSRLQPLTGFIKEVINLNDTGSNKETYHIEIEFTESITYSPGDAAGIMMPADGDTPPPAPRLYSIASSQLAYPNELHLTVSHALHIGEDGKPAYGVCSHYLSQLQLGDYIQFYIQRNHRFKLPSDETDIIMVGPGTGIAPFRSFVQERAERGATGRNWLFFGEQYAHLDFLYQAEWQDYINTGALARIDLAFSRDQREKIYVQHKMKAAGEELMDWLDTGATLYVCGAKSPMSEDVEETLLELLTLHKGSREEAENALLLMAEEDRYVKDVY